MRRREFITLLGGAATAWPMAARAQQAAKRPLIAYLSVVSRERTSREIGGFLRGLHELDYVEGRDFDIAYRFAEGRLDRSGALATELLSLKPSVMFAVVTPAAVAAKALTATLPIVCPLLADPIVFGLIASDAHPGGNVTGVRFRIDGLAGKQLEYVLQIVPDAKKVGMLVNVASGVIIDRQEAKSTAQKLGVELIPAEVRAPDDLDQAFHTMAGAQAEAAVALVDGMMFNERARIADLAATARLPVAYGFRDHVDAGGLISYGVNLAANFHRAATHVVKILKGAKPGDHERRRAAEELREVLTVARLFVGTGSFTNSHREAIVALAAHRALPAIYSLREFVSIGGLIGYGSSITDAYRQAGIYAGRILKGEKPADLPVMQSTKFELVLNLKTAKALGLEVPDRLLALADEVIE